MKHMDMHSSACMRILSHGRTHGWMNTQANVRTCMGLWKGFKNDMLAQWRQNRVSKKLETYTWKHTAAHGHARVRTLA